MAGLDLIKLLLNSWVVRWESTESSQGDSSLVEMVTLDQVTWCFREDQQAHNENDGPCELDGNGNAVRASILALVGSIVHDCGEEQPDGDCKLVGANNCTTDPFGSSFGLIKRNLL